MTGGSRPIHEETTPCKLIESRQGRPYHATAPSCTASPYKQALLRSTGSDAHLLWSHARARDAPTSSCSSRPSSILNNEDLSRFNKTSNHFIAPSAPPHPALKGYETQGEASNDKSLHTDEEEPTAYDQHLYYNVKTVAGKDSSAKQSLVAKRSAEGPSERLLQGQLSVDLHGADSDEDRPKSDLASLSDYSSTEPASPAVTADHDWSRNTTTTCSSVSAANSFDLRMFEDSDGTYYQLPYIQTPPPPPPPPLNLRPNPHNYPTRSLAGSAAELQEGRRFRPFPETRVEAQRSHPDLMSHVGSSSFKWSSPPHGSPKGLQRATCVSMGTVTGSGTAARMCSTGDFPPTSKQGKTVPAHSEQVPPGNTRAISRGVAVQQRAIDHHIHVNPSESNTSVWHHVQSHPRQSKKQRTAGHGEAPDLRAAPMHASQDVDGAKKIPISRPIEAAPPHRIDGTTQTEVPTNSQPTWPSTPSPPPPRHPPPVFFPSRNSSPEIEDPTCTNNQEILPVEAGHQNHAIGDPHHDQEYPGSHKQQWTHTVEHQHSQLQDNASENEFPDAHQETHQYQEIRPGDRNPKQACSGDLRHREVQCSDESGQMYPGDRILSDRIDTVTHEDAHGEDQRTLVNLGDAQSHETRPHERQAHEAWPSDPARPHHYPAAREATHPDDRHLRPAHQHAGRPRQGQTSQAGEQRDYGSEPPGEGRNI